MMTETSDRGTTAWESLAMALTEIPAGPGIAPAIRRRRVSFGVVAQGQVAVGIVEYRSPMLHVPERMVRGRVVGPRRRFGLRSRGVIDRKANASGLRQCQRQTDSEDQDPMPPPGPDFRVASVRRERRKHRCDPWP